MKTVFVDRDGVINVNRDDHVKSWKEFVFLPGVVQSLAELTSFGFRIVVITNQAAINRGIVSRESVELIHRRMVAALRSGGAVVEEVLCCPHRPEEACECRKPQPGLLLQAAIRLGIDLTESYLIGDALTDIRAAQEVGSHPILVLTGRGLQQLRRGWPPDMPICPVCADVAAAVRHILVREGLAPTEGLPVAA